MFSNIGQIAIQYHIDSLLRGKYIIGLNLVFWTLFYRSSIFLNSSCENDSILILKGDIDIFISSKEASKIEDILNFVESSSPSCWGQFSFVFK